MNKIIFTLLFLFLQLKAFADTITLVYIDLSDRPNLESVLQFTDQIITSNDTDEYIVFISYDDKAKIVYDVDKIEQVLRSINETPSKPFINDEIESINELMYKRNILKNNKVHFSFLLTPSNRANRFINRLLLTNRLVDREGLDSDVKVSIYPFGDKETEEYKSNCNIFKEKKYEINY
jgi:hypothetical protein